MQGAGKEEEYLKLLGEAESVKLEGGALDSACSALQELVSGVTLKAKVLEQACEHSPLSSTFMPSLSCQKGRFCNKIEPTLSPDRVPPAVIARDICRWKFFICKT